MSTTAIMSEILFSEQEMEKIASLGSYELRLHHPDDWGVPGHWRMSAQGRMVYTEKGVEALAQSLDGIGYKAAAVCLRAKLKELRETPSLGFFARSARRGSPWFRQGGME